MNLLLEDVKNHCKKHNIAQCGIIIATSGGPDSQCLLDIAGQLQSTLHLRPIIAVGIDHGLRPEAAQELDLAERLAQKYEIPFERIRVCVPKTGNIMQQAREVRYNALQRIAKKSQIHWVLTGHTATEHAHKAHPSPCP